MAILSVDIQFINNRRVKLVWTGTDGYPAWIFRNGVLVEGPFYFDDTERSYELEISGPTVVEVHEVPADESCISVFDPLSRQPTLWWSPVDDALSYLVHRTPAPGADELLVAKIIEDGGSHHEYRPARDIRDSSGGGACWNGFRVEAVNARGVESERTAFDFLIPNLPLVPADMAVSGSGGVFDFEVST